MRTSRRWAAREREAGDGAWRIGGRRARDRGVHASRVAAAAGVPRRRAAHRRLPRPLRPRHVAALPRRRPGRRQPARGRARRDRRRHPARSGDVRHALPRHRPRRVPDARRGARRRRARAAPAPARPPGLAREAAARPLLGGGGRVRALRGRGVPRGDAPHVGHGRVVARPRPRPGARPDARGGDPRGAVAGRLDLPVGHRQRHRGVHGLRRGARGGAARADRRGALVGHAPGRRQGRELGVAVRGPLPGRAERADVGHGRLHAPRDRPRAVRRGSIGGPGAVGVGAALPRGSGRMGAARLRAEGSVNRPFAQVDVFTAEPYRGNPVAVVLDGEGLGAEEMQRFASWTNLSETTFVLPPQDRAADYRVRIFTPVAELPFAGHPTLGTCHAWLERHGGGAPEPIIQECAAGLVTVRRTPDGLAFAAPPLLRSGPVDEELVRRIAATLRLERSEIVDAQWVDNGPGWVAVLLESAAAVLAVEPGFAELDIGVVGPHPPGTPEAIEVRAFFPKGGTLVEDPVTGSLNASLAEWLLRTGRVTAPYVARQGTALGRAGRVHVSVDADGGVWVGGGTVTCVAGSVEL